MTDQEIWQQLKAGSHSALETIYRRQVSSLYDYGRRFSTNESTVEDCIQELFIELWNNRETIGNTDAIKPYLFTSLRRKILKTVKKERLSTDTEMSEVHFEATLDIESLLVASEEDESRQQRLKEAFAQLSDRQREVLYLKYYADTSYEDIATQMDMNYQSARNLVHRAISKLAKVMKLLIILFLIH